MHPCLQEQWLTRCRYKLSLRDSKVAEMSACGIAVHHAGLEYPDRREIEGGFKQGDLHMIVSTSVGNSTV